MNILYLGSFPPAFMVRRSGGKIDSLYRTSEAIIKGLRSVDDINLKVITSPDVFKYPQGPLYIKHEKNKDEDVTVVSMLNLPIIKQWWTIVSMVIEASKHIRKCHEPIVVMIPYVVYRHVKTLRILHSLFPQKVIQACIVPDIFFPTTWRGKRLNRKAELMASKFDCFVLYTEQMAEKLNIEKGKYIVVEGFRAISDRKPIATNEFRVVYAGSLKLNYGINRLIEAIPLVEDNDIHFHFYGSGDGVEVLSELAIRDKRVHYHGRVSNAEATDAVYSASVLINPRNSSDGEYTAYSFPSKDIEYMATGIPTLLCKLPGMPKEYYGHFIDLEEASPESIAGAIVRVKSMSQQERDEIGRGSRGFIVERMNEHNQAVNIIELFTKSLFNKHEKIEIFNDNCNVEK